MRELFLQIVKMSVSASLAVLLVLGIRLLLKKAPRTWICALWALVAVRLLVPSLPASPVSLIPEQLSSKAVAEALSPRYSEEETAPESDAALAGTAARENGLTVPAVLWIVGTGLMLLYMVFSYIRVGLRVRESLPLEENVYLCDRIEEPFIFGLVRPKICLPGKLRTEDRSYVLAHERMHIRRLDPWRKLLGFLLLSVYWFNPLMWLSYILLCRDIELACDECVVRGQESPYRKEYTKALLDCSLSGRRLITVCPLAFGETAVKTRVRYVLRYRKPGFGIMAGMILLSLAAAGCSLTDPERKEPAAPPPESRPEAEIAPTPGSAEKAEGPAEGLKDENRSSSTVWYIAEEEKSMAPGGGNDSQEVMSSSVTVYRPLQETEGTAGIGTESYRRENPEQ
ncbi:MAG: hypothetical protein II882_00515 [Lachnospiraceae bacterium]|nr:hypothetical protein [Lachnospiraceae bacterium]